MFLCQDCRWKMAERQEWLFQGRVQGVGFRYTTQKIAQAFEVVGWVKNLPDGRVQVVVEGETDELNPFLAQIQQELGHYLSGTNVRPGPQGTKLNGFQIRY